MLLCRWIGALVRASVLGGLDRTLGLVFGIARGAALVVFAYIAVGMVIPIDHWPDAVLKARALPLAYQGPPGRWRDYRQRADHGSIRPRGADKHRRGIAARPACWTCGGSPAA